MKVAHPPINLQKPSSFKAQVQPKTIKKQTFGQSHDMPSKSSEASQVKKWEDLALLDKMKLNWNASPNKRELKILTFGSLLAIPAAFILAPAGLIMLAGVIVTLPMGLKPFIKALQNKKHPD